MIKTTKVRVERGRKEENQEEREEEREEERDEERDEEREEEREEREEASRASKFYTPPPSFRSLLVG